jgi:hypothetical protein
MFGLMIATVYIYMLGYAAFRRQWRTILVLLISPVFLYIFFGPR